jgi:hypothetical protein
MRSAARGERARHSNPEVPDSTSIGANDTGRVGLKPDQQRLTRRGAPATSRGRSRPGTRRRNHRTPECALQVRALGQLERVEAAAREIEQLIALDLADGAQLAAELVTLAQQLRLAVAAAFGDPTELDRHEADAQEIPGQGRDRVGRAEPHAEAAVPQPPAIALLLPAREWQDQRAIAPLRILVRIAPVVVDDLTPPDELAHKHEP